MFAERNSTISETALVKQQPVLKKRQLSLLQHSKHNFSLGKYGENLAVRYLTSKHFTILDQNVRYKNHEVDIIAFDGINRELVFVEVKWRKSTNTGNPSSAVTKKKISSMATVARHYLQNNPFDFDYRFDIIAIAERSIEHFENITWNN